MNWHKRFLRVLRKIGNVGRASKICGVGHDAAYQYAKVHPEYMEQYKEAKRLYRKEHPFIPKPRVYPKRRYKEKFGYGKDYIRMARLLRARTGWLFKPKNITAHSRSVLTDGTAWHCVGTRPNWNGRRVKVMFTSKFAVTVCMKGFLISYLGKDHFEVIAVRKYTISCSHDFETASKEICLVCGALKSQIKPPEELKGPKI